MILNPPFSNKQVHAGEPVTAQAWNEIVVAIGTISAFLESSVAASLKVQVQVQVPAPNVDLSGVRLMAPSSTGILSTVRVTATSSTGVSTEAVRPVFPDMTHTFQGLPLGSYTIRAEAPGFDPATKTVAVTAAGAAQTETINLPQHGSFMPLLFGKTLAEALALLGPMAIAVDEIRDVTGVSVPAMQPGSAFTREFVLMQVPAAGVPVAPGEFAKLLISAALRPETMIEMPSLLGLTLSEANQALEAVGLKLGRVATVGRQVAQTQSTNPVGSGGGTGTPLPNA